MRSCKARDARDPEREFTKNTRNVLFTILPSSSSFVVVVFDDDDETVAGGEMTSSSIVSLSRKYLSVLCVCSKARTKKTEREKREKEREAARACEYVPLKYYRVQRAAKVTCLGFRVYARGPFQKKRPRDILCKTRPPNTREQRE